MFCWHTLHQVDLFYKLKHYSVAHGSGHWCHALMPLSLDSFIISPSCCFCCIIQRKEFILGRMEPTSFHSEANTSRGQIHGADGGDDDKKSLALIQLYLISAIILERHFRVFFQFQKWQVLKKMIVFI